MLAGGAREVLVGWVYALLVLELLADVVAVIVLARWFVTNTAAVQAFALRITGLVVILHAIRVAIFSLGRIGPWIDFDVRPEAQAAHADRWTWGGVWFASILSLISVVVLIWFWSRSSTRGHVRDLHRPNEEERSRRDSVSMVGPYARIRVIVAVVMFLIAFAVIGYRSLFE